MSAMDALQAARAVGVDVVLNGDDLALQASSPPADAVLEALSRNKAGIVALLRPGDDGWNAEDWQVYFDERAGIAEFDGGLSRGQAEAQAFACCVTEWMNQNPQTSSPDRCLACGGNDSTNDPLLPFGADPHGHAWLHSRCWDEWFNSRKSEAASELVAIGIAKPANFPNDFGKNGSA